MANTIKDCHCKTTGAVFELIMNELCRGLKDMELEEIFICL